ncbi:hypothetical protein Smar_0945 [Staphylothermus marinus F1]|uniref:Polysaccharide biosynthesis protein n=1 Tax=Staphylothermus marinus (strain ATCC 43588 / DSM 3639 / JCM 9404 / F1) TaxID=399550 RepID=A3DN34_STAMF|nr:hypothetical protein [Staphylothermus marinus]ABN70044.1 hypothetical protein Smar_0945 [Staphylothermus marinus F1]
MSLNNNNVMTDYDEIRSIRVRYSSLVNYSYVIYRAFTSLLFSIIVIRRLPPTEYGLFTFIIAFIGFFIPVNSLWNFWAFRFYARGRYGLSFAAFTLTIIYSIIGFMMIYSLLFLSFQVYLYGVIAGLIFTGQSLYLYFQSILYAKKPYLVAYISMVGETFRVLSAYMFVVVLKLGVIGALASLVIVFLLDNLLALFFLARLSGLPRPVFSREDIVVLFKNAYIPFIQMINQQIKTSIERLFTTLFTSSTLFSAYLGVSYVSRSFIFGRGSFARSLSSRLLRSGSRSDVEDVFRILVIITFLVGGGFITYSRTVLSIFRREYLNAQILLILYTIAALIDVFAGFFSSISTALEKADLRFSGSELRKTVLFKNPFHVFLANISYISAGAVAFMFMYVVLGIRNIVFLLIPFPIAYIIAYIPLLVIFYHRSIEKIQYSVPWREVIASIIGVTCFSIFGFVTGYSNIVVKSIYRDYIYVLIMAGYSLAIYFVVLYLLSPWFRGFVRRVLEEII